jgi:hypothetical protein
MCFLRALFKIGGVSLLEIGSEGEQYIEELINKG